MTSTDSVGPNENRPVSWVQAGVLVNRINASGTRLQFCESVRFTNLENDFVEFLVTFQRSWQDGTILNERPQTRLIHLLRRQSIEVDGNAPKFGPQINLISLRAFELSPRRGELFKGIDYELFGAEGKVERALKIQLFKVNNAVVFLELQTPQGVVERLTQVMTRRRISIDSIGRDRVLLRAKAFGFNVRSVE